MVDELGEAGAVEALSGDGEAPRVDPHRRMLPYRNCGYKPSDEARYVPEHAVMERACERNGVLS